MASTPPLETVPEAVEESVATIEQPRSPTPPASPSSKPLPTPTLEVHPPAEEVPQEKQDVPAIAIETNGHSRGPVVEEDEEDNSDVEIATPVAERPLPPPKEVEPAAPHAANGHSEDRRRDSRPLPPVVVVEPDNNASAPPTPHDTGSLPPSTPMSRASSSNPNRHSGSATSFNASRGNPVSVVLIASALETIIASKEAKRSAPLKDSATAALEMIRNGQGGDRPREIFEPLRLACETKNEKLMIASLDCISKLISYSFFAENVSPTHALSSASPPPSPSVAAPPKNPQSMSLAELVTDTITQAYTESTPDAVSLQIVKALLALVLSNTILVHSSPLLKAVRTVYNVFLLSTDPVNQMVAQGGLTQMVNHVFSRAKVGGAANGVNGDSPVTPATADMVSDIQARLAREGVVLPRRKNSSQAPTASAPGTPSSPGMHFPATPGANGNGNGYTGSAAQSEAGDEAASVVSTTNETLVSEPAEAPEEGSAAPNGQSSSEPPLKMYAHSLPPAQFTDHTFHSITTDGPSRAASRGTPTSETASRRSASDRGAAVTTNDLFIRDAFLVFRALCKLTMKPLNNER